MNTAKDTRMNTAKVYSDSDGNDRTIHQMVKHEPNWAANRIQAGENALDVLAKIKAWDIDHYMENGAFALPDELRALMQNTGA